MDRRAFLLATAAGAGLAACATPPVSLAVQPSPSPVPATRAASDVDRRAVPHVDLEEATVSDLAGRMTRGELTSRTLVEKYVARIAALDRAGPTLRSILELNPDAMAIAAALDEERRVRGPRGPLHGIPVVVKDNIDTGDKMQTTAGSLALVGAPARKDADVVVRLREAGAVLLGKTNLSEWANCRSSRSVSGWSGRGGLTRNPYALDRNASGSSSGSAAAVAASLAAIAIGTETDGSIVSPSSVCGLVGVKPTVGLLGGAGIVPISHSWDTAGPMARTVTDAALLLGALARKDYMRAVQPTGARGAHGARIGVLRRSYGDMGPLVEASFAAALEDLRRLGAVLIDPVEIVRAKDVAGPELDVLLFELKAGMATYLATRPEQPARTLEDLVKFNAAHAAEEMPWFRQELFEQAVAKGGLDSPHYIEALASCRRIVRDEGISAVMAANRLDAIVAPTGGPAWRTDFLNGDNPSGSSSSSIAALAGYPSVTVPCGSLADLPLGISILGAAWTEETLLQIAYAYEQATHHRRPPTYRATIDA
jgi:amidase